MFLINRFVGNKIGYGAINEGNDAIWSLMRELV